RRTLRSGTPTPLLGRGDDAAIPATGGDYNLMIWAISPAPRIGRGRPSAVGPSGEPLCDLRHRDPPLGRVVDECLAQDAGERLRRLGGVFVGVEGAEPGRHVGPVRAGQAPRA